MTSRMLRPIIDIAMTLLLLLSMAYELVGPAFAELCEKLFGFVFDGYEYGALMHEAIGTAFLLLVAFHLWLNRRWLMNMFKGRYNAARTVLVLADILLIIDVVFLTVSGVMMSRALDLYVDDGMSFARTAHLLSSYWGYVIMSFHIGLHFRKFPPWFLAPMAYGVYAFIQRQIGFCTHEGSGMSGTENSLKRKLTGAEVLKGLAVRGSTAQNSRDAARKSVTSWLSGFGLAASR